MARNRGRSGDVERFAQAVPARFVRVRVGCEVRARDAVIVPPGRRRLVAQEAEGIDLAGVRLAYRVVLRIDIGSNVNHVFRITHGHRNVYGSNSERLSDGLGREQERDLFSATPERRRGVSVAPRRVLAPAEHLHAGDCAGRRERPRLPVRGRQGHHGRRRHLAELPDRLHDPQRRYGRAEFVRPLGADFALCRHHPSVRR